MARPILDELHIHPAIRQTVATHFQETVNEVQAAIGRHRVVVVGMAGNPFVGKAKKLLQDRNIEFKYLEYGSYFNQWRRRNALKMCTGWATFPMVFVDGVLLGGYRDLETFADANELTSVMAAPRT